MKLSLASHALNNTYLGNASVSNSSVDPIPTPDPVPDPAPTPLPDPVIPVVDPTATTKFDRTTVILISSATGVGTVLVGILVWWCACKKSAVQAADVNHLLN